MKTLFAGASLAAILLASAAIAQTAPGAPVPAERPAPADRAVPTAPPMASPSSMSDWRASKLIGTAVYNQANERIGDVNEILLDNSGKVARVVLGVGGFLGMGEHEVAVPFTDLKVAQDGSTMKIVTSYTKQSLTAMPQWRWNAAASTTTR